MRVKTEVISSLALPPRGPRTPRALQTARSLRFVYLIILLTSLPPRVGRGGGGQLYPRDTCTLAGDRCSNPSRLLYYKPLLDLLRKKSLRKLDRKLRRNFYIFYPKNVCQRGERGAGCGGKGRQVPRRTEIRFLAQFEGSTMNG